MTIRAKFRVISVTRSAGWNGVKEMHTVKLQPVAGGSEENSRFYGSTPSGSIDIGMVLESVGKQFDIGQEFYVDFTPAPKAE